MVDESRKLHSTATVVNKFEENRIREVQILYTLIADSDNTYVKKYNPNFYRKMFNIGIAFNRLRPYFSTNLTLLNPTKNPTSYLIEAGFK